MTRWNLLIDIARCENCNNCTIATKDEHCGNDFPGYAAPQLKHGHDWIKITRRIRGSAPMVDAAYLPETCNQCREAPCVKASSDGAVYQREDGIVIIDPIKAKGRPEIVASCPYGAIHWNEELQLAQKWIFDAHLLDQGWQEPRCAQACPTGAITAVKMSDEAMEALAEKDHLEVLRPELGTKPRIYYKNLYRYSKSFIAGSISINNSGIEDCLAGASVELIRNGKKLVEQQTDSFGDFKFDSLESNSGLYELKIISHEHGMQSRTVDIRDSTYVGVIQLANAN